MFSHCPTRCHALIIAEKPSLARAIANALPASPRQEEGALVAGDTVVTWCLGHLLEQAPPDAYDPALKTWRLDSLPILPERWKLMPRPKARSQLAVIRRLLKRADQVVHAGDPDREGQLLVQEVIEHLAGSATWRACWSVTSIRRRSSALSSVSRTIDAMSRSTAPPRPAPERIGCTAST